MLKHKAPVARSGSFAVTYFESLASQQEPAGIQAVVAVKISYCHSVSERSLMWYQPTGNQLRELMVMLHHEIFKCTFNLPVRHVIILNKYLTVKNINWVLMTIQQW